MDNGNRSNLLLSAVPFPGRVAREEILDILKEMLSNLVQLGQFPPRILNKFPNAGYPAPPLISASVPGLGILNFHANTAPSGAIGLRGEGPPVAMPHVVTSSRLHPISPVSRPRG